MPKLRNLEIDSFIKTFGILQDRTNSLENGIELFMSTYTDMCFLSIKRDLR